MTAPPRDFDLLHSRWAERIDQLVHKEVWILHWNRQIWCEMKGALVDGRDASFLGHYAHLYISTQAATIRRAAQASTTTSEISLARLLNDVLKNPAVLTRERFVERWVANGDNLDGDVAREARATYDDRFGDGGAICNDKIDAQLDRLATATSLVTEFVDRTIAHHDSRGVDVPPTFGELDLAIDTVGEVAQFISLLVAGRTPWLEMVIPGDWKQPFRGRLFPSI